MSPWGQTVAERIWISAHVGLGVWVCTPVAAADAARDPVAAEALFQQGKAHLRTGDSEHACDEFLASFELDPAPSVALKIARCHERSGKVAAAWFMVQRARALNQQVTAADPHRRQELERYAEALLGELEPRLPKVVLQVEPLPAGAVVERDGVAVPRSALGQELVVEPGAHRVVVQAPDFEPADVPFEVAEGQHRTVLVTLRARPAPAVMAAPAPPPPSPSLAPSAPPRVPPLPTPDRSNTEHGGLALGLALSAAGATLGAAIAGVVAIAQVSASSKECNARDECTPRGVELRSSARGAATAAYIGLGAAALLGGGALFVHLIVDPRERPSAQVAWRTPLP